VRYAAFLVAGFLALGLALGDALDWPASVWGLGGAACGALALVLVRGPAAWVPLALLWGCAGASLSVPDSRAPSAPALPRDAVRFEGLVAEPPTRAYGRTQIVVALSQVEIDGRWRPLSARARLSAPALVYHVALGDAVLGRARFGPPRVLANPGAGDVERSPRYRGLGTVGFLAHGDAIVRRSDAEHGGVWPWIDRARAALAARIGVGELGEGPLVAAFFLGDRGRLTRDDREAFQVTGLSHTLAVSGQHLAVIAFLLYRALAWLLCRWPALAVRVVPRRVAAALGLGGTCAYTLLAGAPYSAVRALAMVALYLGGAVLGRVSPRADALCLGSAAILGASPGALFDAGFQLSVLAVLGLLYLSPRIRGALSPRPDPYGMLVREPLWRRAWRPWAGLLAATAGAALATSPLVAYHFQLFTPLGLLGSLLVVPILELFILPVALGALLFVPLADLWAVAEAGALVLRQGLELLRAADSLATSVPPPSGLELACLTAAAFLLPYLGRRPARWAFGASLVALAVSWGGGAASRHFADSLRITFLSVGHGDAAVVQLPRGGALLVDGGGAIHGDFDVGREVVAPALRALGVTRLEAVVLSHPHPDHARGLAHVLRSFEVRELWVNGRPLGRAAGGLEAAARERGVALRMFRSGSAPVVLGGVELEILHPLTPAGDEEPYFPELGENDNSLVLALRYGAFRALFPGDLEAEGEAVLLEAGRDLGATVLKAPHHGSRTSSTATFLQTVAPSAVVFSVGEGNAFGFPDRSVAARYAERGVRLYRTDRDGAVQVVTDGKAVGIRTLRSKRRDEWWLAQP
jgi:competence protein ComEC